MATCGKNFQKKDPRGIAVLLSNKGDSSKHMKTGSRDTTHFDITEHLSEKVTSNQDKWGEFRCKGGSVSVWVPK